MTDDVVDDAADRFRRNRQLQVSRRPRRVEADDAAARVDERAARESRIERQVEREEVGPGDASGPGVDGADDPPAGPRPGAHGEHHVPHANRVGVAGVGHGDARRVDSEDGDVERGVPTDDRGRRRDAVRPRHGHVVLGLHGVVRGDDQAGMPVDARRRHARPAVHGHDRPTRSLDRRRQLVRERKQLVHVSLPAPHVSLGWERPATERIARMGRSRRSLSFRASSGDQILVESCHSVWTAPSRRVSAAGGRRDQNATASETYTAGRCLVWSLRSRRAWSTGPRADACPQ